MSLCLHAVAVLVGVSRIRDYWHHVSDVAVGGAVGLAIAAATYFSLFPLLSADRSHAAAGGGCSGGSGGALGGGSSAMGSYARAGDEESDDAGVP